jgi:hypothetical protein
LVAQQRATLAKHNTVLLARQRALPAKPKGGPIELATKFKGGPWQEPTPAGARRKRKLLTAREGQVILADLLGLLGYGKECEITYTLWLTHYQAHRLLA